MVTDRLQLYWFQAPQELMKAYAIIVSVPIDWRVLGSDEGPLEFVQNWRHLRGEKTGGEHVGAKLVSCLPEVGVELGVKYCIVEEGGRDVMVSSSYFVGFVGVYKE